MTQITNCIQIVNAIIHRDYSVRGTSIMVEVHDDRVIIKNPGGFPAGMSQDKIGALSVRRNELIADIFARMHRSERMGSGFKRIRESMETAGLPFPKISSDEFFFIEFERPKKTGAKRVELGEKLGVRLGVKLGVNQNRILELIAKDKFATIVGIAAELKLSTTAVENNIAKLKEKGMLRREGSDKAGHWLVLREVEGEVS